jgi:hypothetical protein
MKTAAADKDMANRILDSFEGIHGTIMRKISTSFQCGCGQTEAITAEYLDYTKITVGICESCGTDYIDEVQPVIS